MIVQNSRADPHRRRRGLYQFRTKRAAGGVAEERRRPLQRHALRLTDLPGRHLAGSEVAVRLGSLIALRPSETEPHVRKEKVLRHSPTITVHGAEAVLGISVALLGG